MKYIAFGICFPGLVMLLADIMILSRHISAGNAFQNPNVYISGSYLEVVRNEPFLAVACTETGQPSFHCTN